MKNFFNDFKAFLSKGNVIDLALGVVIGGAFGKIITSLVNDIIMPLVSTITGSVSFTDLKWVIKPADELNGITELSIRYGNFIQALVDFLIIGFFIFLTLRFIMKSHDSLKSLESNISKRRVTKAEKKMLSERGIDVKDRQACVAELAKIAKEKEEAQALSDLNKPKTETQEDILKDIRTLLSKK